MIIYNDTYGIIFYQFFQHFLLTTKPLYDILFTGGILID
nr:MAG TPA: hypothetical protein [Caudoviricetes sp.]